MATVDRLPLPEELVVSRRQPLSSIALVFVLFATPLYLSHLNWLGLPFFWDELGQFVPTALDLWQRGWLVARSTVPNVHPPGLEAYLALTYSLFHYSIPVTRLAMLLVAAIGLTTLFFLSIDLTGNLKGAPALLPPALLLSSPLFYMQSMMAQLDMPAMTLTLVSLLFFIRSAWWAAAATTVLLVLVKETGIVVPAVFAGFLLWRHEYKRAALFLLPLPALTAWLFILHARTGHWMGDPGFAHYNVTYSLHPIRVALNLARRLFYLFVAEFRWVGTAVLVATWHHCRSRFTLAPEWQVTLLATGAALLTFVLFGGAELERYLLPVLPVFYIALSVALTYSSRRIRILVISTLLGGQLLGLFLNPPYPFPLENNLAMTDFVRLQKTAASFAQTSLNGRRIATAWPYTAALRNPAYGYVATPFKVVETGDFKQSSIAAMNPDQFDALIVYTRTWIGGNTVLQFSPARQFLARFYDWEPQISARQCAALGLRPVSAWQMGGQEISIYLRNTNPL